MLDKEDRLKLKEQEREYQEKAKEHRAELKELKTEQRKAQKSKKKNTRILHRSKSKKATQKPADPKKILFVFPIRDYIDKEDYFITDQNSIINLFQIQGRSYYDASDDEIDSLVCSNAKFLEKYSADFKIISMNYPTNTLKQQSFLSYMLKRPDLQQFKKILSEKLASLQSLDQTTTDRQAFLMVFAKDKSHYLEQLRLLSNNSYFVVKAIDREKKENIIFQLNNMNKRIKV